MSEQNLFYQQLEEESEQKPHIYIIKVIINKVLTTLPFFDMRDAVVVCQFLTAYNIEHSPIIIK